MTTNEKMTSGEGTIVLHDLQSLLRESIDKGLIVVDYTTTSLLPPGENYGSTMLKVEAVIKRTKNSAEEKLHLVAKMIPTSDLQSSMDATVSFGKEIFVIKELVPALRELEKEMGVEDEELIDTVPKYYGSRMTLNEAEPDKADKDVVMLMENIRVNGYYTVDRLQGLDFDHAKLALTELAHFHALSMAMKQQNSTFFNKTRELMSLPPYNFKPHEFDGVVEQTLKIIFNDERACKYEDRIKKVITTDSFEKLVKETEAVEPWVSISHGDFWCNNMMFRKGEDGKVSNVKFVDYQISKVSSPLKDLPYFICTSVNVDVMDQHLNDLLDVYHQKLIKFLKRVGCDVSSYTKEKFIEQLKKDANTELFRSLLAIKFIILDVTDVDVSNVKSNIMLTDGSDSYKERCWKIVSTFIENEWI